ncbi:MAG: hypothetical protein K1X55_13615 [Chitinophagales bacterium]|nr:hypothetical protein [Chitinophagales bacterium]
MNEVIEFIKFILLTANFLGSGINNCQDALQKAQLYDNGVISPAYIDSLYITVDVPTSLQEHQPLNWGVAGMCHHDYETYTPENTPNAFETFKTMFFGHNNRTMRLELDYQKIYNCEQQQIDSNILRIANWNIDQLQEAGYNVRIWFTEMPVCLATEIPEDILPLIPPDIATLIDLKNRPPKSVEQFKELTKTLVKAFSIDRQNQGKTPVTLFEGWNEIDSPGYFIGSMDQFYERIHKPMAKAVEEVENEYAIPLSFSSHSVANPFGFSTYYNTLIQNKANQDSLEIDQINWHWYGNYPFSFVSVPIVEDIVPGLIRLKPWASAKDGYNQAKRMKQLFPDKQLLNSEWNFSGGGGSLDSLFFASDMAAYFAGTMIEMEAGGMDDANHFLLKCGNCFIDEEDNITPGGYGIYLFNQLEDTKMKLSGINYGDTTHDVSTMATYGDNSIKILLTRYLGRPDERVTNITLDISDINNYIAANSYKIKTYKIERNALINEPPQEDSTILSRNNDKLLIPVDMSPQSVQLIEISANNISAIATPNLSIQQFMDVLFESGELIVYNTLGVKLKDLHSADRHELQDVLFRNSLHLPAGIYIMTTRHKENIYTLKYYIN